MNFSLLPSWAASRTPISCRSAASPGRLKKGAFDETLSRGPVSGPKPHRNRPVLLSHKTVYRTAIYGSQKQDGSMPSPRAPHRLRPGEHERSGPHLADRCSQETRLRQGSHLCRQSFRGPLEATRPRCLPQRTSARRCVAGVAAGSARSLHAASGRARRTTAPPRHRLSIDRGRRNRYHNSVRGTRLPHLLRAGPVRAEAHSGTNPSGSVRSQGARPQRGPETARSQRPEGSDGQNNVPGQVDAGQRHLPDAAHLSLNTLPLDSLPTAASIHSDPGLACNIAAFCPLP